MKKVCYLLPQYDHNSAENFYHIINFLSELGKKVELYVIIENSTENPIIDNVQEIFIVNEKRKKNYIVRFLKIVSIYFLLYRNGVKIFFSRASSTGIFPLIVANRIFNFNRANILFWNCGQDVVPLSFKPNRKNIIRVITRVLQRVIFKGMNYLATGPELMVEQYHKNNNIDKKKILLFYNDISLNRFFPITSEDKGLLKQKILNTDKKVMLFVHTFNYSRGTDLLHRIALKIKEKKLNILIVAIGRVGDYSNQLKAEIEKYKLDEYLVNLGTIPNRDIVPYYQMSDLFIMPSRGEGFPRVLIESMACRTLPLSFDVGGVRNILHSSLLNETVVSVNDENKFINNSIKLIQNDSLLEKYSELSYEKVQSYSTQNIVKMYCEQFKLIS